VTFGCEGEARYGARLRVLSRTGPLRGSEAHDAQNLLLSSRPLILAWPRCPAATHPGDRFVAVESVNIDLAVDVRVLSRAESDTAEIKFHCRQSNG
jgi:hypothetical protein